MSFLKLSKSDQRVVWISVGIVCALFALVGAAMKLLPGNILQLVLNAELDIPGAVSREVQHQLDPKLTPVYTVVDGGYSRTFVVNEFSTSEQGLDVPFYVYPGQSVTVVIRAASPSDVMSLRAYVDNTQIWDSDADQNKVAPNVANFTKKVVVQEDTAEPHFLTLTPRPKAKKFLYIIDCVVIVSNSDLQPK